MAGPEEDYGLYITQVRMQCARCAASSRISADLVRTARLPQVLISFISLLLISVMCAAIAASVVRRKGAGKDKVAVQ